MTENDVRILADKILQPILGPIGFTGADIEARPDHDGEESLFVIAHFQPGSPVGSGKVYRAAHTAVWDALLDCGESRFPYVDYDYVEDPADFDNLDERAP